MSYRTGRGLRAILGRRHRLTYRVGGAVALWMLPCIASMKPHQVDLVRDAAVGVLVVSVTSWVAGQGKRRTEISKEQ